MVALTSEFPNDNPVLHRGVSWVCLDVTGPATAVIEYSLDSVEEELPVAPEPVAETMAENDPGPVRDERVSGIVAVGEIDHDIDADDDDADDEAIVVEELPPLDETACVEGVEAAAVAELAEPATTLPPRPDDSFVALVSALSDVAIGAGSPHVASVLAGLLLHGTLDHAMPADAAQALAEADIAHGSEVTQAFLAQMKAWRAILGGTSDDFGACGNPMLDEWASDLLARLLGAPSRAASLRRDLRTRGVAAFGLVEAA
jgi:hypothetical protein